MTKEEYLLTVLSEECAEVTQRISKALRFGLAECEPEQPYTNLERIRLELNDLFGVCEMLTENGIPLWPAVGFSMDVKKAKVLKYMDYSRSCGTLEKEKGAK